jgi:hypothetical protein
MTDFTFEEIKAAAQLFDDTEPMPRPSWTVLNGPDPYAPPSGITRAFDGSDYPECDLAGFQHMIEVDDGLAGVNMPDPGAFWLEPLDPEWPEEELDGDN